MDLKKMAKFFKVLSDPTRLSIVMYLLEGESCVSCIVDALGLEQSVVSHQLRILKDAYLVIDRREGKHMYYNLDDDHVSTVIKVAAEHLHHRGE